MLNTIPSLNAAIAILAPKQHIFLLSHMRAYTSLFGHIMGSNPSICGYYEMHIGYHSWKSLIRQKLLYFREEQAKSGFTYMFDKILHNDHAVSAALLDHPCARTIFSLRRPQDTIPSILALYASVDPAHAFNSESFATQYYIERLAMLEKIALNLNSDYFYLDAHTLVTEPEECLNSLSDWLELHPVLSSNYNLQKNTSRERYGDTSESLKSGQINRGKARQEHYTGDIELMNTASTAYSRARNLLINRSARHCLAQIPAPYKPQN